MVPSQGVAAALGAVPLRSASGRGGAQKDVLGGPVVLDEIQVHGGEAARRAAEVGSQAHTLQKYFRQNHGRAHVQINASSTQLSDERGQQQEIAMAGGA